MFIYIVYVLGLLLICASPKKEKKNTSLMLRL